MDTTHQDYPYLYFTAVNRGVNPYLMQDNELWDSVNFWTERTMGAKKVRPGFTPFLNNPDSLPVKGLFYVKFPNGYVRLARVSGKTVYAVDPTTASTWGSSILTPITSNFVRPDFTILAAKGHIVDQISDTESHYIEWTDSAGTDTMTDTTYTSSTDTVVPYKGKVITTYHQRVYVGSPYYSPNVYKSRLSWSTIEYANWGSSPASPWTQDVTGIDITSANWRDIDQDYNGNIIKLTNINDRINIYKENQIYRYNESQVFSIFGMSPILGTIATVAETEEDYWLTDEGFFKTDGNTITPVSDGWYPIIKQIFANGLTPSKFVSAGANFLYFCYLGNITYDGQTISNAMFVYSTKFAEMSLWSLGFDVSSIGTYVNSSEDKIVVFGDTSGKTYYLDYSANDDAGTPITAYLRTKYFFFDSVTKENNIDKVHALATEGSEMNLQADPDFSGQYNDLLEISDVHSKTMKDMSDFGQFYTMSFRVSWNGKGNRPEFYGIVPGIIQSSVRMPSRGRGK